MPKATNSQRRDRVDVVVPIYNRLGLAQAAVESARAGAGPRLGKFIFVDDGSTEKQSEIEAWCRREGVYLRNPKNMGFARTCNRGSTLAMGDYFVLLNTDTVAGPNWLEPLIEVVEHDPQVAIVGPLLTFPHPPPGTPPSPDRPPGMVQSAGFAMNIQGLPYHRLIGWSAEHPKVQRYRDNLQGITGAVWLIRRVAWQAAGGFFEPYGSYYEDADLCIRLKVRGWKIAYQPQSRFTHLVGASWDGKQRPVHSNIQLFLERVKGKIKYDEWALV